MVEPTGHLFGMTAGGLSGVDLRMPLGGIAREIFGSHQFPTAPPSAWNATILSLLARAGPGAVSVESRAGDITAVERSGSRLMSVRFASGFVLSADYFLDCSYEGDLLRLAGVSYALGREAASEYNESLAGVNGGYPWNHSALAGVSPFEDASNTTLIPTVVAQPALGPGEGDGMVQAYNFRLTLTNESSNRLPLAPPPNYTPAAMEFLRRWFLANPSVANESSLLALFLVRQLGDSKVDINQGSVPGTSDLPGLQIAYPTANWTARAEISAQHEWWTRAIWNFLREDKAVPPALRAQAATWGLAADEFVGTGGFTPQLYVRESIRLRGEVVLTQADVYGRVMAPSMASVGLSQWLIDVHDTQRIATRLADGTWVAAEAGNVNTVHDVWQVTEIPFGALLPQRTEAENLAVPVCASFTHVAFATFRLEPQYAVFGQSAAVAAVLAGRAGGLALQDVNVSALQLELLSQGQLLNASTPPPPPPPLQPLTLAPCTASAQQWTWHAPDGSMQPAPGGLCASIFAYSNASGAHIVAADCHPTTWPHNQAFDILPAAGGGVLVRSRMSQLCIAPFSDTAGAELVQTDCSGGGNLTTAWKSVASSPNASDWELLLPGGSSALCAAIGAATSPSPSR